MAITSKPVRKEVKKASASSRKDPNDLMNQMSSKRDAKKDATYPVTKGKIVGLKSSFVPKKKANTTAGAPKPNKSMPAKAASIVPKKK